MFLLIHQHKPSFQSLKAPSNFTRKKKEEGSLPSSPINRTYLNVREVIQSSKDERNNNSLPSEL
jgi:hypothetical protein